MVLTLPLLRRERQQCEEDYGAHSRLSSGESASKAEKLYKAGPSPLLQRDHQQGRQDHGQESALESSLD